jgi:hypothetical protein
VRVQEHARVPVHADRVAGRLSDRAGERAVLDGTAVDEQVLVAAGSGNVTEPRVARPATRSGPDFASKPSSSPSVARPKTCRILDARSTAAGASSVSRPFDRSENATDGLASAPS